MAILSKLVAKEECGLGYVTYVFELLEQEEIKRLDTKYIMCTRYPNWDHRQIEIEEIGYLNFLEIRAGIDKWFNGEEMIPYKYDGIQFIKFVLKPKVQDHKYIMLINL